MIACNNAEYLIVVKPMKKIFGDQIWAKIGPETRFSPHFFKFGSLVFLEIAYNDSLQQFITSSNGKTLEKIFRDQIWAIMGQNHAQN